MKRQSIAEATLSKQIKRIYRDIEIIDDQINLLGARRTELTNQITALETELSRLERARQLASEKRK